MILPFKLERSREKITARSGLTLFEEFMEAIGVDKLINNCMPNSRSNRGYDAWHYVQTLLLTMCGGGEGIAETREIRNDIALKAVLNLDTVPSESAIGDWLKRMGIRDGRTCVKKVNKEMLHKILRQANIKEIVLVNDPSIIKSEKRDAKKTYEGYKGYDLQWFLFKNLVSLPIMNLGMVMIMDDGSNFSEKYLKFFLHG